MSSGIFNKYTGYHNRRSVRLHNYDYSQPGYYFVTICIYDRTQMFFGNIISGNMELNSFGCIVRNEILKTEQMRPNVKIDEYVIMPNHCHVILHICRRVMLSDDGILDNNDGTLVHRRGTLQRAPTEHPPTIEQFGKPTSNSIPTIIRLTKSTVTKQINIVCNTPGRHIWQRNYYEHIIRDDTSLFYIRQYIRENKLHWENDSKNHIDYEIEKFEMVEIEEF